MARPHPALIELAAGRPLPQTVEDPDELLESAAEHRMHGLLWSAVARGEIVVPLHVERHLALLDLSIQARHRKLWAALDEVTNRLGAGGIEVAVFKGVAAEAQWYGRIGERPSRDLDLWLSPHQLDRADEVLELLQPDHALTGELNRLVRRGNLQSVDVEFGGVDIDLHFDPFKMGIWLRDLPGVWARRVPFHEGYATLDPASALMQFLLHLNKDRFSWLLGVVDVARLVQQDHEARSGVRSLAVLEGMGCLVGSADQAVSGLLGVPFKGVPTRGIREVAWRLMWPPHTQLDGNRGYLRGSRRQFLAPFLCEGRLKDSIRFFRRLLAPPQALIDYYYPGLSGGYPSKLLRARAEARDLGAVPHQRLVMCRDGGTVLLQRPRRGRSLDIEPRLSQIRPNRLPERLRTWQIIVQLQTGSFFRYERIGEWQRKKKGQYRLL